MKRAAVEGRKMIRSLNYKKTIICLKFVVMSLSFCFGLLSLVLIFRENPVRFNQYSTAVYDAANARTEFSKEIGETKSLRRRMENLESTVVRHSLHDHDQISLSNRNRSVFGLVMSEFACRVLSRHVTNSNVLVVAPSAVAVAKETVEHGGRKGMYTSANPRNASVGNAFIQYGVHEGHTIHAINSFHDVKNQVMGKSEPTLDAWWRSFGNNKAPDDESILNEGSEWWWSMNPVQKPEWILLAVFDSIFGSENSIWKKAESFLNNCTVTYIVIAIHSEKQSDGTYKFGGIDAIELLLHKNYKLQILSSSHYHAHANNERGIFEKYGPNALFQSIKRVKDFLRWGANAAYMYGEPSGDIFTAYIFATQGLDLAIPTPQQYLRDGSTVIDVFNKNQMTNLPPIKSCPGSEAENLDFVFDQTALHLNISQNTSISYVQDELDKISDTDFFLWMNGNSLAQSEALCIRNSYGLSRCKTRVSERQISSDNSPGNDKRPNVLLILLDPISRSHFDRTMPKTTGVLKELNFIKFERYTAVGPNSGPNQAALYSGIKLKKRDGLHKNLDRGNKWLWDRLRESGYVTLKGEDSCVENSNMMQSLAPNTTHGSALHGLFCFNAFSRPNCIGPDLASSILFDYGYQFILKYERLRISTHRNLRWASFMHFVDSHEDTMLLSATLDPGLSKFLRKLQVNSYFENSVVIVCSDHGLHYGPHFSTLQGRKEAKEPILYIHIPHSIQHRVDVDMLNSNSHLWTTPFDLHETLIDLTQTSSSRKDSRRQGLSLTEHLPASREKCETTSDLIPSSYCDIQRNETQDDDSNAFCRVPSRGPTLDSFFLDIPPMKRRPQMNIDVQCHNPKGHSKEISKFDLCNQESTI